jgi:aspartyl-tRNA(Asn)/glutamyl-tRNA(Gln) amidotransferase subunit B
MAWDTVIGLEVHAQLKTKSKLFSPAATTFGAEPNSQASFIDVGLPGILPALNEQAVSLALRFGIAINAQINHYSYFERKHYFYPDLPKGYQISQYQSPIIKEGHLPIKLTNGATKHVRIIRAHLEEDAGKSLHDPLSNQSGIDLNRAGNPLLEIVTAPCLSSAEEAVAYLRQLHQLVLFLDICDGNLQEGSFRCDVNISLKPKGSLDLGVRTELKNLNSFRFIEKAIAYEEARHKATLESGQSIKQETRLYSPDNNTTQVLRSKESQNDYRYFPDPDLLPILITEDMLERIKQSIPKLPEQLKQELRHNPDLKEDDIHFLLSSPATYQFFCSVKEKSVADEKTIVNWLRGPYAAALNASSLDFERSPVSAFALAELLNELSKKEISSHIAKHIFTKLWQGEIDINSLIQKEKFNKQGDQQILELIQTLVHQYPQQVNEYRNGKQKLLTFFVGQIMKETKGHANPEKVRELLEELLHNNS